MSKEKIRGDGIRVDPIGYDKLNNVTSFAMTDFIAHSHPARRRPAGMPTPPSGSNDNISGYNVSRIAGDIREPRQVMSVTCACACASLCAHACAREREYLHALLRVRAPYLESPAAAHSASAGSKRARTCRVT